MLIKKLFLILFAFLIVISGLNAEQVQFPAGHFWSLDGGLGMSDMLIKGTSFQLVIEPKLWISVPSMVGAKFGVNYSFESGGRDILTFETLVFYRWNFLQFGQKENPINAFAQGGIGLVSAYRGNAQNPRNLFRDVTMTRGSLVGDVAAGITVPLSERWHVEGYIRGGYPHLWGITVTAGYKFRLPQGKDTYHEIVRDLPPKEIVKRIMITSIEYIIFAPDIGRYNISIDRDAQALNELVLNSIAQFLKENPDCVVRIDGHANPITDDKMEADELAMLSRQRSLVVAEQLRSRGITDDQMVIIYHGGDRAVIPLDDTEHWNRNRRVELVLMQIDGDAEMETN